MTQILLVEDSEECHLLVKRTFKGAETEVISASSVKEAKQILEKKKSSINLVLLDLILPDGDGFELLEILQNNETMQNIPVFLLTTKDEITSKVLAFGLGADDYIVKPVNPVELKARVEMRLRKKTSSHKSNETLRKGSLVLHTSLMKASIKVSETREDILDLTAKEFRILAFLAKNEGTVYSRADLVKTIWGNSVHVLDRTVDSHICGLRKKLRNLAHVIECIPSAGYRFYSDKHKQNEAFPLFQPDTDKPTSESSLK